MDLPKPGSKRPTFQEPRRCDYTASQANNRASDKVGQSGLRKSESVVLTVDVIASNIYTASKVDECNQKQL
jgi:hypothetical protein